MVKQVFISFSGRDRRVAEQVLNFLEDNNVSCWISYRDIPKGADYPSEILRGIRGAEFLVLIASSSVNQSEHIKTEISYAFDERKVIIPYKIEDFAFADSVSYFLSRRQWIDAFGMEQERGLNALLAAIREDLNKRQQEFKETAPILEDDVGAAFSRSEIVGVLADKSRRYPDSLYREFWKPSDSRRAEYRRRSDAFCRVAYEFRDRNKAVEPESALELLVEACLHGDGETAFKIYGESGTGKSHLMQMVFYELLARFSRGESSVLPIYVPLGYFQRSCTDCEQPDIHLYSLFKKEYKEVLNYCLNRDDVEPLLLVSNIRNYVISEIFPEKIVQKMFKSLPHLRRAVTVDTGLTENKYRIKKNITLASASSNLVVKAKSYGILEERQCLALIGAVTELCGLEPGPEEIYELAVRLRFPGIDIFTVKLLVDLLEDSEDNPTATSVYEKVVCEIIDDDQQQFAEAAAKTYRFVSGNQQFPDEYRNNEWSCLARHNSFRDFLLAYHFRCSLEGYKKGGPLDVFLRLYPEPVVRFIDEYIAEIPSLQENIHRLITENYISLTDKDRALLIFWAGRVKNINILTPLRALLQDEIKRVEPLIVKARSEKDLALSDSNKALQFLYRMLVATSVEMGKSSYLDEYICNLLINDSANSLNKGYLLRYYNDIVCDYCNNDLDIKDSLDKGLKTISVLDHRLAEHFAKNDSNEAIELQLFSFFSLLQTRIEDDTPNIEGLDLLASVEHAVRYLSLYKKKQQIVSSRRIMHYFDGVAADFEAFLKLGRKINIPSHILNAYLDCDRTKRANWREVGGQEIENVSEHIYGAYLIGLFMLPQNNSTMEGYDKAEILNMILIHDLGEVTIGDESVEDSEERRLYFNALEDTEMRKLMQKGTYTSIANLSQYYNVWCGFNNSMNVNSKIAHDIDIIHTVYRFFLYLVNDPQVFGVERQNYYRSLKERIMTPIGFGIYKNIIEDNLLFQPLL